MEEPNEKSEEERNKDDEVKMNEDLKEEEKKEQDFTSVWEPTNDVIMVNTELLDVDDGGGRGEPSSIRVSSEEILSPFSSIPPNLVMKTVIETLELAPELLEPSRLESEEYKTLMQDLGYMEGLKSMDPYLNKENEEEEEEEGEKEREYEKELLFEGGEEMIAVGSQEMEKLMKEVWMMGEISMRGGKADPMILRLSYAINEIKEVGKWINGKASEPYEPLENWIQEIAKLELRYSAIVKEAIQYIDEIKRQGTIKLRETIDLL